MPNPGSKRRSKRSNIRKTGKTARAAVRTAGQFKGQVSKDTIGSAIVAAYRPTLAKKSGLSSKIKADRTTQKAMDKVASMAKKAAKRAK